MNEDWNGPATLDYNSNSFGQFNAPPPKGWWGRNWKWFIPSCFLFFFIVCCGCPGAIFFNFIHSLKQSELYQKTMQAVRENPEVKEAFGEPIRDVSWFPSFNVVAEQGKAKVVTVECRWAIEGPKGSGEVFFSAHMSNEKWEKITLEVITPDEKSIPIPVESLGIDLDKFNANIPKPEEEKQPEEEKNTIEL